MMTPFDWQEGIATRAQYIESRLMAGTPVVAVSLDAGILIFTVRRQAPKIFEIYDRLAYAAIGQLSDVESMRVAALDFAHQEGFQRSEQDVTIQRVVNALSQPLKRAFGDLTAAPLIVRSLFAELGKTPAEDLFYLVDYDGDFSIRRNSAYLPGSAEAAEKLKEGLSKLDFAKKTPEAALELLKPVLASAIDPSGSKSFESLTELLVPEAALLERVVVGEDRFRIMLPPAE